MSERRRQIEQLRTTRHRQLEREARERAFVRELESGGGELLGGELGGLQISDRPVFWTAGVDLLAGIRHRHKIDPNEGVVAGIDVSVAQVRAGTPTVRMQRPDGTWVELGDVKSFSVDRIVWSTWLAADTYAWSRDREPGVQPVHDLMQDVVQHLHYAWDDRHMTQGPSDRVEFLLTRAAAAALNARKP